MKKRIGLQGFLLFLSITVTFLLSKFIFPSWKEEALDEFLDAVGIGLVLFGFLFRICARGYKAEKSHQGESLITDGPYSLTRNPMYFGTLLIGTGIITVLFELWAFFIFFAVFLLIYIPQINKEENILYGRFGEEYRNYCKAAPKYFPNLFGLLKADLRDNLFLKWPWIKKEIPSLTGVIVVIILAEIWEDVRSFGRGEYIKELLEFFLIIAFFTVISVLLYYDKKSHGKR